MLGAIIGDIVGSRFEFNNHKNKEFELFTEDCFVTDDSIMSLAVAKAIMETEHTIEPGIPFYADNTEFRSLLKKKHNRTYAGNWTKVSWLRIRRKVHELDVL